jgi:uncharacterized OB-fold protein
MSKYKKCNKCGNVIFYGECYCEEVKDHSETVNVDDIEVICEFSDIDVMIDSI